MPIVSIFRSAALPLRRFFALLLAATTAALAQSPSAADGFDPNVDGNVYAVAAQPDGKIILAGQFGQVRPNGGPVVFRNNLARINADGSLDATFDPNADGVVRTLALQGDGKILIGGDFASLKPNGAATATTRNRVARLNADGTLDTTFNPNVGGGLLPQVNTLLLLSDGRIVIGGSFSTVGTTTRNRLARLNADGSLDARWDPNANNTVFGLAQHSDGKILVVGGFTLLSPNGTTNPTTRNRIARLNPDGTPDSEFDPNLNNRATAVAVERDGKILIGGDFTSLSPNGNGAISQNHIARLNVDGSLDTAFTGNASGNIAAFLVQPDGSILAGGTFSNVWSGSTTPVGRGFVARYFPNGTVDLNFSAGANSTVDAFALQPDGKIVIAGYFTGLQSLGSSASTVRNHVARLNPNGSLDATLNLDFGGRPLAEAVQKDGKIIIGGSFTSVGGGTHNHLARLNADGSVDTTFKPDFNGLVLAIVVQPADQKILVGGTFTTIGGETRNYIARLNPTGTIDSEFNPDASAQVAAIALQSDGKILIAGAFATLQPIGVTDPKTRSYLARLNADGSLDSAFHPNPNSSVYSLALQSDGKILVGGIFQSFTPDVDLTPVVTTNKDGTTTTTVATNGHPVARNGFARLNTDGTVDTNFDPSPNSTVNAIAVQSDGKIVIGGSFSAVRPNGAAAITSRNRLARLNADGTVDTTYDPDLNGIVLTIALQSDGNLLVGGAFTTLTPGASATVNAPNYTLRKYAARIKADGTVDPTFNLDLNELNGNRVDSWFVLPDGHILVGGNFISMQPVGAPARVDTIHFARLNANGTLDPSFVPGVGGAAAAQINAIALQADGKMVVAGAFADLGGVVTANLARFTPEGIPDYTFYPAPGADGPVNALLVRPDAESVLPQGTGFAWLNADGSVRTSFAPVLASRITGTVTAVAVQPDGNVLIGGTFTVPGGVPGGNLMRFSPNGVLDTSFNPTPDGPVEGIALQPDGKIVIVGGFVNIGGVTRNYIARINADGTLDTGFNPNPSAHTGAVVLQPDGKIVIGGSFVSINPNGSTTTTTTTTNTLSNDKPGTTTSTTGNTTTTTTISILGGTTTTTVTTVVGTPVTRNNMARLNSDGTVDTTFDPNPNGVVNALVRQADGKIIAGGAFLTVQPNAATTATARNHIARINSDGTVDTTYDPNFNDAVSSLALFTDGKVIAGGAFSFAQPNGGGGATRNHLLRLNTDGTLDSNFDPNITNGAVVTAIAVQADAKIVIGGTFVALAPNGAKVAISRNHIARLNFDGSLDTGFNPDANGPVNALALAPDGTIVLGGAFTGLSPNSSLLVAGSFTSVGGVTARNLALLGDDGSTNSNFIANPNGAVNALLMQPDGKYLVGGVFTQIAGVARNGLARFNADNSLDTAFNPTLSGGIGGLALQPDGKIVITGGFTSVGGQPRIALARLNADGSVDSAFSSSGLILAGNPTVQSDGKILVAGSVGGGPISLVRFNADGSRDASFNVTGSATPPFTLPYALQTDGRIIVANTSTGLLARFNANGTVDPTFNPAPNGPVTALALQPDGRVIIGGKFTAVGGLQRGGLARLAATTAAAQSLSATSTTVVLARSGSGPELSGVTFEVSTDNQTWTKLGIGGRVSGTSNWQLNGVNLPPAGATPLFYIRARGLIPGAGTSSGALELIREVNLSATPGVGPASNSVATLDIGGLLTDSATGLITGQSAPSFAPAMTDQPIGVVAQSTIAVGGGAGGTGSARLVNFSARARVSPGGVLITGFAIGGDTPRTVLLRAAGPSLGAFGVTGVLAKPRLLLIDSNKQTLRDNIGWTSTPANMADVTAAGARTGAFPFSANSGADSAVVVTLPPGAYSMQVADAGGAGGVTLAEIYDAGDASGSSYLMNLSIRGDVNLGDGSFLSGFVLAGDATRNVLVRGAGPALTQFGVPGALADPIVNVFGATGQLLASNDNWSASASGGASLVDASHSVGAFPLLAGSKDAALSMTIIPGTYTVQVIGANSTTGAALIEVYELP